MALALSSPSFLRDLTVLDIAPTRGSISEEFKHYLRTMRRIEDGERGVMVKSRREADDVMKESVEVSAP